MKKIVLIFVLLISLFSFAFAQYITPAKDCKYTEASTLTMVGKMMPGTPNPYHRVDTNLFKGFTSKENLQVRMSTGMAVVFRTNSPVIYIYTDYATPKLGSIDGNGISNRGYDLYIKKDGEWLFAAASTVADTALRDTLRLIKGMDNSEKECLLFLPLYSEERSIQIGVAPTSHIAAIANPFRHRICIFGSSFTHGAAASRPSMAYPSQWMRYTGIQMLNLGCSGQCLLQSYFADVLCAVEADAFVFDAFSNPHANEIQERLFPFIEKVQAAHPGVPLIFQRTIMRSSRNFNMDSEYDESTKMAMADSLMAIAAKKYHDVYYIRPDISCTYNETSVDGTHPDSYGYYLWEKSIEKPLLKILKKYGIK